jgi:crotonobetainyl-CoA:carnitine CoA-transferase CaiB-like acyl-CoA transferase
MKTPSDVITPLQGVRVVSIALNLPGPACVRRLADMGATVTKIEPPTGDPMTGYSRSYYEALHRGIKVHTLDLKDAETRTEFDTLLAITDVLVTAQRLSALSRLGLDWKSLSARFPKLCHIAIVGDADGETAGHDLTYMAEAGLVTPPHLPRTLIADLAGAERAVQAVFAALRMRDQGEHGHHGHGQRIEVSLAEAATAFAQPFHHHLTQPGDLIGGGHPGYNFYLAQDGWIALAALEPRFIGRIESLLGITLSNEALALAFAQQTQVHWQRWATEHDIPLAIVTS